MRPSLNGYILTPPHKSHFQGVRLMAIESVLALGIGVFILAATPGPGVLTSVAHALSTGFRSYAGSLPSFLDLTHLTIRDITCLAGIVAGVPGCVSGIYAFGAAKARRLISSRRAAQHINRATGTIMIGVGTVMVAR